MHIYRWSSTLLEAYSRGDLIALAGSADEARAMLRAEFDAWAKENREWEWAEAHGEWGMEPDAEGLGRLRAKLEDDLAKEPTLHSTLWLRGSE